MVVAQWNITSYGSNMSGMRRYEDVLYDGVSKHMDVVRYRKQNNILKTLCGYKKGDVTHITSQQLAFMKTLYGIKNCIVTVHDVIPHYWYSTTQSIKEKWLINELCINSVDCFIVDSVSIKNDLIRIYDIHPDNINVVYLGVDHSIYYPRDKAESRNKFGLDQDKRYVLAVSSGLPWKNTKIFESLKSDEYEIIDIGYGRGRFGYIPESDLPYLYSACDIFLSPSVEEGFGLPVVEAMSCGTPVIASMATAYPEVVGRGGILVDPYDVEEWSLAINNVFDNMVKMSTHAVEQSSKFSWDKCVNETMYVYNEYI